MTKQNVLVVDLDGVLLSSDMLVESFWGAAGQKPLATLKALAVGAGGGKALLKTALADLHDFDPELLPYSQEVLERVHAHRAAGGRTALITASHHKLAERIAAYLGCFDEVHGSDASNNLKGPVKADLLLDRFGSGQFSYMGDSRADLAIWPDAAEAITVNAPRTLKARVEAIAKSVSHIGAPPGFKPYLRSMRLHQWTKNVLIFLPLLAAHTSDPRVWGVALAAFVSFSLTASSVYLLNDLLDLASDRKHPRKRFRPLAAGTLPILHGTLMMPLLLILGLIVALIFTPAGFVLLLLGYFAITMVYSWRLKRMLIIDICALAGLYTIRLLGGGVATGITLSPWLLAFSIFLFLSLAAVKRQAELVGGIARGEDKTSGRAYLADDLPIVSMMALASGYVSVVVLALYLNSDNVRELYGSPILLLGVCPVLIYWVSRMVMLTHRGYMDDDPVVFALKDRNSRICAVLMGILAIAAALA